MRALVATLLALAPLAATAGEPIVIASWEFDAGTEPGWTAEQNTELEQAPQGTLLVYNMGADPHISTRPAGVRAEQATHFVARMRALGTGSTQVYFATDEHPSPAENGVPQFTITPGTEWQEVSVPVGGVTNWRGDLQYLRLDPLNGGADESGGLIEIDWIRLEQRPPRLVPVDVAIEPWASGPPRVRAEAWIENWSLLGTEAEIGQLVTTGNGVPRFEASSNRWLLDTTIAAGPTAIVGAGTIMAPGGPLATLRGLRLAGSPNDHSPADGLVGDVMALELVHDEDGLAVAAVLWGREGEGAWQNMGTVAPLASASFTRAGEVPQSTPVAFEVTGSLGDAMELEALVDGLGMLRMELSLRGTETAPQGGIHRAGAAEVIEWTLELQAEDGVALDRLAGPTLLAGAGSFGDAKDAALFPGIEYLDAGERSSGTEANDREIGERWSPRPHQVTIPLMAVEHGGFLVGQMWDGTQQWSATSFVPAAEFASPDFLGATAAAHHMGIFVPAHDEAGQHNRRTGLRPEALARGDSATLTGALFVASDAAITHAAPLWMAVHGLPKPVRLVKPAAAFMDDLMEGWATTLYFPEVDGNTNHWRFNQQPGPSAPFKARVLDQAMRTGNWQWAEAMGVAPGTEMTEYLPALMPGAPPPPSLARIAADGGVPYAPTEEVRERSLQFTQGRTDTLGREGETNSGLIAFELIHVAAHALQTGDEQSIDALLRGLEKIEQHPVPRGSQVWEVHMDAPDIFASTNVVQCLLAAHEITGDRQYLDRAVRWAYTGLPFLYAQRVPGRGPVPVVVVPDDPQTDEKDVFSGVQQAPDAFENPAREVNPYGSIPVFGTSFYVVNWFGAIVQWCGLRWAQVTLDLLGQVEDPVLRAAAEGVTRSGMHQTFDKAPICGLLPDVWDMATYTATGAYIGPDPVEGALRRVMQQPDPGWITTRVARGERGRVHFSARGNVKRAWQQDGAVKALVEFTPGALCDVLVVGLEGPVEAVVVDGRELGTDEAAAEHWRIVDGAVVARLRAGEKGEALVEVK